MFGKTKKTDDKADIEAKNKELLENCKVYKNLDEVPRNPFRVESLPAARLVDKFTRDRTLNVTTACLNVKDKSITACYLVNVDSTATTAYPYSEILKHFGWTSFSVSENEQTIYPKW